MANTFKYLVLSLVRNKGMMVWTLAFPLILSTCFAFMFAGLDGQGQTQPVRTLVVEDAAYHDDAAFQAFIKGVAGQGEDNVNAADNALLAPTFVPTMDEARRQMDQSVLDGDDDPYVGIVAVDAQGQPQVTLCASNSVMNAQMGPIYQLILVTVMDTYSSRRQLVDDLAQTDPAAFAKPAVIEAVAAVPAATEKVSLTQNTPKESVRYYFALLGFAAVMGAQTSLIAVTWLLPRTSALGARRSVGGTSRLRSLAGTLAACWVVSFLCLVVAYVYIRLVAGVDFAGRDLGCLVALAVSSLMATALGAVIAVLPKVDTKAKSGILTSVVCLASLFAGLYGQPTMELADTVAAACPASQWINPAVQVSQALFSLMYYDTLGPFVGHLAALLVMGAVFFACSAAALRRQRYASL